MSLSEKAEDYIQTVYQHPELLGEAKMQVQSAFYAGAVYVLQQARKGNAGVACRPSSRADPELEPGSTKRSNQVEQRKAIHRVTYGAVTPIRGERWRFYVRSFTDPDRLGPYLVDRSLVPAFLPFQRSDGSCD